MAAALKSAFYYTSWEGMLAKSMPKNETEKRLAKSSKNVLSGSKDRPATTGGGLMTAPAGRPAPAPRTIPDGPSRNQP